MSFVHNALRAYRDKYIVTGSARPLIQVMSYVGFGMFFVECVHHQMHTRVAKEHLKTLESQVGEAKGELQAHLVRIQDQRRSIQAATTDLANMEVLTPSFKARVEEAQARLDKHIASLDH